MNKLTIIVVILLTSTSFSFAKIGKRGLKYVPNELIVKLKEGREKEGLSVLKSMDLTLKREHELLQGRILVVKTSSKNSIWKQIGNLKSAPSILYAEPNYIYNLVRPVDSFDIFPSTNPPKVNYLELPKDPLFPKLWGLLNDGKNDPKLGVGVKGIDINAIKAWELEKGNHEIKIAIIDTGVDYTHPELKKNIWVNEIEKNGKVGVDDDGNGYIDDIHGYDFANKDGDPIDGNGHGSHCAGIIAASHNEIGVAGVMARVTIVPIKFLSDGGSGTSEDALLSIDYATKLNVDIMSNSWGGGAFSEALKEAIEEAAAAGIVFVAAAGNSANNNDEDPQYPSSYKVPNIISVAAHTAQNSLADFSSFGGTAVDIAAPGTNIISTHMKGGYKGLSGTSMATPYVSGAIGLLISFQGRIGHQKLHERLTLTSVPEVYLRGKTISSGRLDAFNLLTNKRPTRIEPKPKGWIRVALDKFFESKHPYPATIEEEFEVKVENAKFMRVVVKKYELENGYDFLRIIDSKKRVVESISGEGKLYHSSYVDGDSMIIKFDSDSAIEKWGFLIEAVEVQY